MCLYVCLCVFGSMCLCMSVCTYLHVCFCRIYKCICVCLYMCMSVCLSVCLSACVFLHGCICVYVSVCMFGAGVCLYLSYLSVDLSTSVCLDICHRKNGRLESRESASKRFTMEDWLIRSGSVPGLQPASWKARRAMGMVTL